MIRVSKNKNGVFCADLQVKSEGRGAYICASEECIKKCLAKKLLNKNFKCEVGNDIYGRLAELKSDN
jgi:predicted RNA-binding protein YlxR (DUF448 family)